MTQPKEQKYYTDPRVDVHSHVLNDDGTGSATLNNYEHLGKRTQMPMNKDQMDVLLGKNRDPEVMKANLVKSYSPTNFAGLLNKTVGNLGQGVQDYAAGGALNKSLLYGGAAALAGAGYGALTGNGAGNRFGRGIKGALLGAGGAGLAYLLYKLMSGTKHSVMPNHISGGQAYGKDVKANFFGTSFHDLTSYVTNDQDLSFQEKADILRALPNLSPGDKSQLSDMLLMGGGAGAGTVIARFLGAKGLLGMGLGAILGGIAGWSLGGPSAPQLTASGLISSSNFK